MSSQVTPKKNAALSFYVALTSQANTNTFQSSATLTTGDVKVSTDGAAFGNITTLPVVTPAAGKAILVSLSSTEMNGDNVQVLFSDAAGAEWCDYLANIQTTARQVDDLAFPTVSGRSLDVTATGEAGIDWANIGGPTTVVDLSGTNIKDIDATGLANIKTQMTNALTSDVIADSVPADGSRPTIAQALYMLSQFMTERSVSGLTMTVKKVDGTTSLMTFTLNDASNPTSITRAT